ncbi:Prolyl-tRNA editing protein ProX [Nymphon striatum]|nr:Prolyl-tRNA editing protein ProX [Nymphon striatum]
MAHSDRPNPETITLDNGNPAATPEQVLSAIEKNNFEQETKIHEPLFTVEQSKKVTFEKPGAKTKNLFLRNKKGRMVLLVVEQDRMIELKELRDRLQLTGGHLSFASTDRLGKFLGVVPGGGEENGLAAAVILGLLLILILFSGVFAFLGSFGFMESFASDHRDGLSTNAVSFLGWILFLLGCAFFLFNWNA